MIFSWLVVSFTLALLLGSETRWIRAATGRCYEPLCGMQVAFLIPAIQETDFILPYELSLAGTGTFCLRLAEFRDIYCSIDASSNRRIIVPFALKGTHRVYIASTAEALSAASGPNSSVITEWKYYISSLPTRPLVPSQPVIRRPLFGEILEESWTFDFQVDPLATEFADSTKLEIISVSKGDVILSSRADHLNAGNIEPSSWFLSLQSQFLLPSQTAQQDMVVETGYPINIFYEFVLSPENITRHRRYSNQWKKAAEYSKLIGDSSSSNSNQRRRQALCENSAYISRSCDWHRPSRSQTDSKKRMSNNEKINVCIWGSNKMDGQKSIWLQQVQDLSQEKFRFTWVLTSEFDNIADGTVVSRLNRIASRLNQSVFNMNLRSLDSQQRFSRISLINSPFSSFGIQYSDLDQLPNFMGNNVADPDSLSCSASWKLHGNGMKLEEYIYEYAAKRLSMASYVVENISPKWVQQLYGTLISHMQASSCSVLVYGNDRGFNADVLLRDAARMLRIPTVVELLNLFMAPGMLPDVVVAPSMYAYQHESISAIWSNSIPNDGSTSVVIIPPGVDAQSKFNKPLIDPMDYIHPHRDCQHINDWADSNRQFASKTASGMTVRCMHIAFVARLAPEKNIGLFILAAHQLLLRNPLLRFTLVGDGIIRKQLTELAEMLDIDWAVKFVGWLDDKLPRVLATVDIVINPSIRGWSETFCIANIEAMSMEIPIVTFAIGGIGDYVDEESIVSASKAYSVSSNAVIVNKATPEAIAEATMHLVDNEDVRIRIGKNGRQTVLQYFSVDRQMDQYSVLYEELAS